MRLIRSLCLFLLSSGALFAERKEPNLGAEIIERLIAPETRLEAFREVQIAKQGEDPRQDWRELPMAAFELYHQDILVTECPQLNEAPPIYMVSYLWDTSAFRRYYSKSQMSRTDGFAPVEEAHKPEGLVDLQGRFSNWTASQENSALSLPPPIKLGDRVIVFLTSEGKVIWPFQGDNLTEGDVFKDLNADGRYERVYSSNFRVYGKEEGQPDLWVQALRVEAVQPDSDRLFYILINWQKRNSELSPAWGWAVRDLEGDGLDEIVIGPIDEEGAEPEARVVYRWDADINEFTGPKGSYDEHYLLLDPSVPLWDELRRVKEAGGMRYEAKASASAPAIEQRAPEAPYDWREREPYRHSSLSELDNEALLDFMCGWSPTAKAEVEQAINDEVMTPQSNHRFEFQSEWIELDPKEAAFTYVDTNQSYAHRNKYILYHPTNLTQAERADWVVLSSLRGTGVEVIRTTGEDAGRYVSAKFRRPLPEKYPDGEFHWEWDFSRMDVPRVRWFQETLWWLAQLRSEAKVRTRGHGMRSSFTTNCFPTYMETSPPTVRLLRDGQGALVDIKADHVSGYSGSWREEFGPLQYIGLANQLYQDLKGNMLEDRPSSHTISELLRDSPTFQEDIVTGRIPPQMAQAMIRSAGDSGEAELLPRLKELEALVPEKSETELEWARLEGEIDAFSGKNDVDSFRAKIELESQMQGIEQSMRDNLWAWLRQPLAFAIRQLEAADKLEALAAWAEQPGEPGALWALAQIKDRDVEIWWQVLTKVFLDQPDWRKRIIRHLAYQDRARADVLVAQLPRVEQLEVFPSVFGSAKPTDMDETTIRNLLETMRADELDAKTRVSALRLLVPRNHPHDLEGSEIDQVLLEILQTEMEPDRDPWPERYLVYDAALALLLRDKLPMPVDLYIKGADTHWNEFSFGSYLDLMIHLAVVKESAEARDWLNQWAHDFIEKDAGAWSRFAEAIYATDLRLFSPFLDRIATFAPQEKEGGSGIGKGRNPELKHGERYHRARQIVAARVEPDALTQAKCLLLLGLGFEHSYGPEGLFHPRDHTEAEITEIYAKLDSNAKSEFETFVIWCRESIQLSQIPYHSRKYLDRIVESYVTD